MNRTLKRSTYLAWLFGFCLLAMPGLVLGEEVNKLAIGRDGTTKNQPAPEVEEKDAESPKKKGAANEEDSPMAGLKKKIADQTKKVKAVATNLKAACAPKRGTGGIQYRNATVSELKQLAVTSSKEAIAALPKKTKKSKKTRAAKVKAIEKISKEVDELYSGSSNAFLAQPLFDAKVCSIICTKLSVCAMSDTDVATAAVVADWPNLKRLLRNLNNYMTKRVATLKLQELNTKLGGLASKSSLAFVTNTLNLDTALKEFTTNLQSAPVLAAGADKLSQQLNIVLAGLAQFLVDRAKREAVGWVMDRLVKDLCANTSKAQYTDEIGRYWIPTLCTMVKGNKATGYGAGSIMLNALVAAIRSDMERLPGTVAGLAVGALFVRDAHPDRVRDNRWFLCDPKVCPDLDRVRQTSALAVGEILSGHNPWAELSEAFDKISEDNVRTDKTAVKSAAVAALGCGLSIPYQLSQRLPALNDEMKKYESLGVALSNSMVHAESCWQLVGNGADTSTCGAFDEVGSSSLDLSNCSLTLGLKSDKVERFSTAARLVDVTVTSATKIYTQWKKVEKSYKAFKVTLTNPKATRPLVQLSVTPDQDNAKATVDLTTEAKTSAAHARIVAGIQLLEDSVTFALALTESLFKVKDTAKTYPGLRQAKKLKEVYEGLDKMAAILAPIQDWNTSDTKAWSTTVNDLLTKASAAKASLTTNEITVLRKMLVSLGVKAKAISALTDDKIKEIEDANTANKVEAVQKVLKREAAKIKSLFVTAKGATYADFPFLANSLREAYKAATKTDEGKNLLLPKEVRNAGRLLSALQGRIRTRPGIGNVISVLERLEAADGKLTKLKVSTNTKQIKDAAVVLRNTMDDLSTRTKKQFNNNNGVKVVLRIVKLARTHAAEIKAAIRAAKLAINKEWGQATLEMTRVAQKLASAANGGNPAAAKFFQQLARYSGLVAALFNAKDSEEVAKAFEQAADPVGGWRKKFLRGEWTLSLTAHVGFAAGAEWRGGQYGVTLEDWGNTYFQAPSLVLPLGFELTRGHQDWCWGIFLSVIDPAAFLQYDLSKDGRLPGARPLTVLAPGLGLRLSPFNSPFSFMPMLLYRPKLRTWDSTVEGPGADALQFMALFSVDVTLFQLYQGRMD